MNKHLYLMLTVAIVVGLFAWAVFYEPSRAPVKGPVIVNSPNLELAISSPLKIKGEALGTWFFEASFPVFLVDWDGRIISRGIAQAKGDWMTTDYVPFEVEVIFDKPSYGGKGAIIFKKDNPSGLPENDAAIEIPVLFE